MAKPWARLVLGYMRHPKFLALNGNAIALWHEGKNYCDEHQTDGLIPTEAVKTFRFRGEKTVTMLLTACATPKPDGRPYAPLWEVHPAGYQMHDYLAHNDCREDVLARFDDSSDRAALRNEANRLRQAAARQRRKAEIEALRHALRTQNALGPTEAVPESESDPQKMKEPSSEGGSAPPALRPRPLAPIHDTSHRKHAVCGRVCLHASLFNDFVRRRNHADADREIRAWADGIVDEWTTGAFQTVEPGDPFDFWKARYAEKWPVVIVGATSKLPAWARRS